MNAPRDLRTFFAVSPDDAGRIVLGKGAERAVKACGGRRTPAELFHLTLVFIGTTPRGRIADLVAMMEAIDEPAFSLQIDTVGWFPRNGVVWAGTRAVPDGLMSVHSSLSRGAERLGFSLDVRPYAPHLTLARDAHRSPPGAALSPSLSWRVGSFELMSSVHGATGPRYDVLHSRALR